jgi:hypothetical protein
MKHRLEESYEDRGIGKVYSLNAFAFFARLDF